MPIIVEDGTGLETAETYVSVVTADAYHSAYGNPAWAAALTAAKEAALRRAAQYIDSRYRFRGSPITTTQALSFPRYIFHDATDEWPISRLTAATCELALRALTDNLYTDQTDRSVTRETVGPLTVEYAQPQRGGQVRFAVVDDLLSPLTLGSGRLTMRLERAS